MEQRQNATQEQAYKEQIQALAACQTFNLKKFHEFLKDQADRAGASGWKSKLPGVGSLPGVQQTKSYLEVLDNMKEENLLHPETFKGKDKRLTAEKVGQSLESINNMLRQYDQLRSLHGWLQKRVERNLPIPESLDQTTAMVQQDPTGFKTRNLKQKQRRR